MTGHAQRALELVEGYNTTALVHALLDIAQAIREHQPAPLDLPDPLPAMPCLNADPHDSHTWQPGERDLGQYHCPGAGPEPAEVQREPPSRFSIHNTLPASSSDE